MRGAEFHALYQQYAEDVHRFAYWLTGNADSADDLTAETFARAWAARHRIRTETVKGYLLAITRNLYRTQRRRSRAPALDSVPSQETPPSGEQRMLHREELRRVWTLLAQSKDLDRDAFLLRVVHGLPYAEIARVLELSVSSAKVRVHRIRLRLALECKQGGSK